MLSGSAPTGGALSSRLTVRCTWSPSRWWDDQLRQNEVVLSGRLVLRFPTAILRYEELLVVDQLTRALLD